MEDQFNHPVISVSLYFESPFLSRVLIPKTLKLGIYTRKIPCTLIVQSDAVIEKFRKNEIKFNIENLEFSLLKSKKNGNCTFLIRDQIQCISRIYQVASFIELCFWFESLKKIKDRYKRNSSLSDSVEGGFTLIPKSKRLSLPDTFSDLCLKAQNLENSTLKSYKNLNSLKCQLEELKNSI